MQVLLKDVSLHLPTASKINTPKKANGIKKGGLNFAYYFGLISLVFGKFSVAKVKKWSTFGQRHM